MKKLLLAGVAAFGLASGSALAAGLTLTAGPGAGTPRAGTIPSIGTNQAMTTLFGQATGYGLFGATVTGTAGYTFTYDILGAEAGFKNQFKIGTDTFTHGGGTVFGTLAVPLTSFSSSSLAFSFVTGASTPVAVANGSNPDDLAPPAGPNFFASFFPKNAADPNGGRTTLSGDVLYLFLDDGNEVDDNHDDLVVRITARAVPVPEPATLGLLGAGLLGLGVAARRRRKV